MTKLEELKAAWQAAYDAATDAGEAQAAAYDAADAAEAAADDAWDNNFIARAAYRAELEKTYKENSDDTIFKKDL
jgi:hypothetical protein